MRRESPNKDKVKKVQELRRSNAAQPVKSKKVYTRTEKHPGTIINKDAK